MEGEASTGGKDILMTDLRIGDQFVFDGHTYTVAEPPQSIWGVVEVWIGELDWALQGSESSTAYRLG